MPIPAFMTITGASQEEISAGACSEASIGTLSRADHEDEIQVQEFRHSISIPTDPQSGQPVGTRIHNELTITKAQDQTTPLLYAALNSGETITEASIEFYRINAAGEQEHYFTTTIENAQVTRIRSYMPDVIPKANVVAEYLKRNSKDIGSHADHLISFLGDSPARTHMDEVTFRYRKISWTHEISGTEGTDDWDGEE